MQLTRRALVVGLAGLYQLTACAAPSAAPSGSQQSTPLTSPPTTPPTPQATIPPTAAPTIPASTPTAAPTPQPSPTPSGQVALDIHLWNGAAEVQLDGRTVSPGQVMAKRGTHQAAALVDGEVVALADTPSDGGSVDLVVPPPLASLAIMIENQADARPQTGLTQADVVYEALAEGGITRFIALYLSGDAPVVGPVRSLRHYFAFLAADYGADVVHIGASPEGYAWRAAMNMGHLDETFAEPGVWRVQTRPPPHNAYTDTAADRDFLQERGRQQNRSWGPLRFSEQAPRGSATAENVELHFRPWPYQVDYVWDASSGRYLRFMEGDPHADEASGDQIAPASVIIQFAEVDPIPNDPKLRLDVNLVGAGGELVIFNHGTMRSGSWTKSAPATSSVWLDDAGNPLVLPYGPVWVEVMPIGSPLSVT